MVVLLWSVKGTHENHAAFPTVAVAESSLGGSRRDLRLPLLSIHQIDRFFRVTAGIADALAG